MGRGSRARGYISDGGRERGRDAGGSLARRVGDLRQHFAGIDLSDERELIPYCTIGGRACTGGFVLSRLLGHERTLVGATCSPEGWKCGVRDEGDAGSVVPPVEIHCRSNGFGCNDGRWKKLFHCVAPPGTGGA